MLYFHFNLVKNILQFLLRFLFWLMCSLEVLFNLYLWRGSVIFLLLLSTLTPLFCDNILCMLLIPLSLRCLSTPNLNYYYFKYFFCSVIFSASILIMQVTLVVCLATSNIWWVHRNICMSQWLWKCCVVYY